MDGNPTKGGINDLRMGTVDKQLLCQTCNCNFENCPGHLGHIELAKPVYHIGFIEECKKILSCVCFNRPVTTTLFNSINIKMKNEKLKN